MSDYMLFALLSTECPDPIRVNRAIEILRGTDEPPPVAGGAPDDGPSDADWDEYAKVAEWQDRLDQLHQVTDRDIEANGLAVG